MTIADDALIFKGYACTVFSGCYITNDTQSFKFCSCPDFTEQALTGFLRVLPDGVTTTIEVTVQVYST